MSSIRRLLTSVLGRPTRRPARTARLGIETLEVREVPAAVVKAWMVGTTLNVEGTPGSDQILFRHTASRIYATDVVRGVEVASVPANAVGKVVVNALGGDDLIDLYRGNAYPVQKTAELNGGDGNDRIYGGVGTDTIDGGMGIDRLHGNDGSDTLYGSSGSDHLYGGDGNDVLIGGNQTDALYGGAGNDWLEAGTAQEYADGGADTNWNAHRWAVDGTTATDVDQTATDRCVVLASMAGAADWGVDLAGRVTYLGNFMYRVRMYDRDAGDWVNVDIRFDGTMAVTGVGGVNLVDPRSRGMEPSMSGTARDTGEFWTILYQRAYVQHFYQVDPMNGSLVSGLDGEPDHTRALAAVTGWATEDPGNWADDITTADLAADIAAHLNRGDIVTVGGTGHAYAVSSVWRSAGGTWMVQLYNPWGSDGVHTPSNGSGSIPFTAFGDSDGRISMTVDALRVGFDRFFVATNPGFVL